MLEDSHTESEQTLIAAGHDEDVLAGRRLLADLVKVDLWRIAASATGRAVVGVLSQTSIEPAKTVHVFTFAPADASPGEPPPASDERIGENLRQALENTESARALVAEGQQVRRRSMQRRADSLAAREERRTRRDEP